MKLTICAVLVVAVAGCSPVAPWPSFYPAEYSEDQIRGVPGGMVPLTCRSHSADQTASEVCAAVHPLEKPLYCEGRTPDGRPGILVPVQLEYRNVGEVSAFLPIRRVELKVGDTSAAANVYYSDFGWVDYVSAGGSRSLTVGFVVAEEAIRAAESFVIKCPCPGSRGEFFEFEFVARGGGREHQAAAPN